MNHQNSNDLLHGVKLEAIVSKLVEYYGWSQLASQIDIKCFKDNPSVKSSLKFLRRTSWARQKIELLYLETFSSNNPWGST
ncbi:MAG: VF530 family protein [Kangiellaceae bacterium]|nr:VF530 family protein [Kangiellaceae bacterium]MCW9016053.1 VF530 family protein [Kangiellaceae bacterium]